MAVVSYKPEITPGTSPSAYVSSPVNLQALPAGGLAATAAGASGTGSIAIPVLDSTLGFCLRVRFYFGGDVSHTTLFTIECNNTALPNYSGRGVYLGIDGDGTNAYVSVKGANGGGGANGSRSLKMQTGRYYDAYVVADGRGWITTGVLDVEDPGGIDFNPLNNSSSGARMYVGCDPYTQVANPGNPTLEVPRWQGLNVLKVFTNSNQNAIVSWFYGTGTQFGGDDLRFQGQTFYFTKVVLPDGTIDDSGWVYLPPAPTSSLGYSLVMDFHPNDSDEKTLVDYIRFSQGSAAAKLASKFAICGFRATSSRDGDSYLTGSWWGAPRGVAIYHALYAQVAGDLGTPAKVHAIAPSMGTVMALCFDRQYKLLSSLVSICGVFSLSAATTEGFGSLINDRWQTTDYVANLAATTDPILHPSDFDFPTLAIVGTQDTVIPPAQHGIAFAAVNSKTTVVRVANGTHLGQYLEAPASRIFAFMVAADTDGIYPTADAIADIVSAGIVEGITESPWGRRMAGSLGSWGGVISLVDEYTVLQTMNTDDPNVKVLRKQIGNNLVVTVQDNSGN